MRDDVSTIDYRCPGSYYHGDQCTPCKGDVEWSKIVKDCSLSNLVFNSLFELSRAVTIHRQTHVPPEWRTATILDREYIAISPSSLGFAFSSLRARCLHVMSHYRRTVTSNTTEEQARHPPRHREDPFEMGSLHAEALSWSFKHPWSPSLWKDLPRMKTLVLLPSGFHIENCTSATQVVRSYAHPKDIQPEWLAGEWSAIVLFSSTHYAGVHSWTKTWNELMKAVARGAELLLLPGPEDEKQWGRGVNRLRDLAEETIAQRRILAPRIKILLPMKSEGDQRNHPIWSIADKTTTEPRFHTITAAKKFFSSTAEWYAAQLSLSPYRRRLPETAGPPTAQADRPVGDERRVDRETGRSGARPPPSSERERGRGGAHLPVVRGRSYCGEQNRNSVYERRVFRSYNYDGRRESYRPYHVPKDRRPRGHRDSGPDRHERGYDHHERGYCRSASVRRHRSHGYDPRPPTYLR
ncbi:hypothetical protein Aduo_012881 [Ancylostoma duodenale]